ncbi:MAG: CHASE2 domain-containing protein, partial [Bdellovibrionales bacterium]|nr:CHASE2 domain-containing protein [Bdellovibrionales bacterium]
MLKRRLLKLASMLTAALASPMTIGAIVSGTMSYLGFEYYQAQHERKSLDTSTFVGILDQIHRKTVDFRLINRGEVYGSDRVAILAIDDASIEREGRWPWPRTKIARLIENAVDGGARLVAFDAVFSEPDHNSAVRALTTLRQNILQPKPSDTPENPSPKTSLSPEIDQLFDREIAANNYDRILASTVGLYNDSVIMGAYFDTESFEVGAKTNPLRDYCIDANYRRSFEKKYWDKQTLRPVIVESAQPKPPQELIERTSLHITNLEQQKAILWLSANPSIRESILSALRTLEVPLDDELTPFLLVWANIGDEESLAELLRSDETLSQFANRPTVRAILAATIQAVPSAQMADFKQALSREASTYCDRFLTPADELLDRDKYLTGIDQPKEILQEIWQQAGFEPLWDELVQAQKQAPIPLSAAIQEWIASTSPNTVQSFERTWISVPEIASETKHSGYFNADLDPDGTIRRSVLLARRGHTYIPSLALKSFMLDRGLSARFRLKTETRSTSQSRKVVDTLELLKENGDVHLSVPVDERGRLMINYSGPQQMFEYISASELLSDKAKIEISQRGTDPSTDLRGIGTKTVDRNEFLKDKILIVGATAMGVYDLRLTPFEENFPGVETHANVLSNLLTEESQASGQPGFLKTHPAEEQWMWIILLLGGLMISALLSWLG